MGKGKVFLKLIALSMAFVVTASYSLYVSAEPESELDSDISEQPAVQESAEEYSEIFDEDESSETDDEDSYNEDDEDSDYDEDSEEESFDEEESSEEEFSWEESSEISEYSYYEPSYYEQSSYEASYYEESSYDYSQPESSFPIVYYYGPSKEEDDEEESENTQFYEEESKEPSTTYQETSIDSSEMTSRDWETFRSRLDAQNGKKSSDNAIRDIKDGEGSQNDNINYLMWGLVLIGMGLVIIGFIIYSTVYTKRKLNENLQTKYKKKGNKVKKS